MTVGNFYIEVRAMESTTAKSKLAGSRITAEGRAITDEPQGRTIQGEMEAMVLGTET